MQEIAIVEKVDGKNATVRVDKKDECSKCGVCLFPKNANFLTFKAENVVDAKKGDTVLIDRVEGAKLTAIILVFLVPLVLILLSSLISITVIKKEIWILWLTLISVPAWFCVLALIDKKYGKIQAKTTKIIKVLTESEKENIDERN